MAQSGEGSNSGALFVGDAKQFFNLDDGEWNQVSFDPNRAGGSTYPPAVTEQVDLVRYFERGMWTKFYDTGPFNVLELKLGPGFTIPRHHHNCDQFVLVLEGSLRQGNRSFGPGDGYSTRAGLTYTVSAGPDGARYIELRTAPMSELETIWDELDPNRWTHVD